jgi:ABC-2 type transport system permease protein
MIAIARALLSAYYAYMLEYRAELFLWAVSQVLPFIMMGLWSQAAATGTLAITSLEVARYFVAVFVVRQFNVVWVVWDFEREVVTGTLSQRLVQPLDPAWRHVAGHMAERLARLPLVAGLVAVFFVLYPEAWWVPSGPVLLVALPWLLLAVTVRFLMQYTVAMLAFWTERASAIEELSFTAYLYLSGMIVPLDIVPPEWRFFMELTPFPHMVYTPAILLSTGTAPLGRGVVVLGGWLIFFWVLNRWLWRRGLRHYSGMGA